MDHQKTWACDICNFEIKYNISRINNHEKSTLHKRNFLQCAGVNYKAMINDSQLISYNDDAGARSQDTSTYKVTVYKK